MRYKTLLSLFIALPMVTLLATPINVNDNYSLALGAYQKKQWNQVIDHSKSIIKDFPDSAFLSEVYFLTGVAYFQKRDYEMSNYYFSQFLEKYATPKYFEEALEYKFKIAEKYEMGAGKHVFGWESMPKWASAWDEAYEIYDEVIKTLPRHEMTSKALYNKARMLTQDSKFKEAVDCYQTLIRRFPKNPLAPEAYLLIAEIYLKESQENYPDRDYLEQAKLNLKKFRYDFPREDKIVRAESLFSEMQDRYAKDLWDSAEYFFKKKKLQSAFLYYNSILTKYPESRYAQNAIERIADLSRKNPQIAAEFTRILEETYEEN